MARRIPKGRKIYSISYLMDKQPKGIRKDPRYGFLLDSLRGSDRLLSLRFNRRCYTLLNRCVVGPEKLESFYRTYRLPRHPFFPLFLSIKRAYLDEKDKARAEREEKILSLLQKLPAREQEYLFAFARWESGRREGRKARTFQREIYPRTLKKARLYLSRNKCDWIGCFETFRRDVIGDTAEYSGDEGQVLIDRYILGLPPGPEPLNREEIKTRYRTLSLENHPDRGGSGEMFLIVKEAYERLSGLC